ncbi:hypothetical protein C8R44DRAFT_736968 [Mycena epipterygia]|nr:hypothetical protein C8R44DRAFT_736968 [Mycena epipterygia]
MIGLLHGYILRNTNSTSSRKPTHCIQLLHGSQLLPATVLQDALADKTYSKPDFFRYFGRLESSQAASKPIAHRHVSKSYYPGSPELRPTSGIRSATVQHVNLGTRSTRPESIQPDVSISSSPLRPQLATDHETAGDSAGSESVEWGAPVGIRCDAGVDADEGGLGGLGVGGCSLSTEAQTAGFEHVRYAAARVNQHSDRGMCSWILSEPAWNEWKNTLVTVAVVNPARDVVWQQVYKARTGNKITEIKSTWPGSMSEEE